MAKSRGPRILKDSTRRRARGHVLTFSATTLGRAALGSGAAPAGTWVSSSWWEPTHMNGHPSKLQAAAVLHRLPSWRVCAWLLGLWTGRGRRDADMSQFPVLFLGQSSALLHGIQRQSGMGGVARLATWVPNLLSRLNEARHGLLCPALSVLHSSGLNQSLRDFRPRAPFSENWTSLLEKNQTETLIPSLSSGLAHSARTH